jgi:hypothetical protein
MTQSQSTSIKVLMALGTFCAALVAIFLSSMMCNTLEANKTLQTQVNVQTERADSLKGKLDTVGFYYDMIYQILEAHDHSLTSVFGEDMRNMYKYADEFNDYVSDREYLLSLSVEGMVTEKDGTVIYPQMMDYSSRKLLKRIADKKIKPIIWVVRSIIPDYPLQTIKHPLKD